MQSSGLRIGTRGSPLALVQARLTASLLRERAEIDGAENDIVAIRTSGDVLSDRPLTEAGGKGLFTKEIDEALLDGRVDLAVHSAKDVSTRLPDGIVIAACLEREDVRDAFLSPHAETLAELPKGARLGSSSLRRRAMALRARPDFVMVDLRGNVETRLRKLAGGVADATLLAVAGLRRLGMIDRAASVIESDDWLPAPGQGVIVVMGREDDEAVRSTLAKLNHAESSTALTAERAFLAALDGSCRTPIGALARIEADRLVFRGTIVKPDGSVAHDIEIAGPVSDAQRIGAEAGAELARRGGPDFFVGG